MRFPAKITSSCIWVAIPVDWVILHWYACGADGRSLGRAVYGHVITKFSRMGRLLHFLTHGVQLARFARESCAKIELSEITNIMMRRWNHNVILFWGISRFLSAVCRRWFPGQSGDQTCLVPYNRLVICFARPFQLLPSACTDIPFLSCLASLVELSTPLELHASVQYFFRGFLLPRCVHH